MLKSELSSTRPLSKCPQQLGTHFRFPIWMIRTTITWAMLLPPRVCSSRKLQSGAELGIKPKYSDLGRAKRLPLLTILRGFPALSLFFFFFKRTLSYHHSPQKTLHSTLPFCSGIYLVCRWVRPIFLFFHSFGLFSPLIWSLTFKKIGVEKGGISRIRFSFCFWVKHRKEKRKQNAFW